MSASEVLARMREEKTKQENEVKANPDDFYVKLRIVKNRRHQLTLYLSIAFVALLFLIVQHMNGHRHWGLIALPVIFVGLLITLIPPTEEWLYKPWQASPRQYERHQIERR